MKKIISLVKDDWLVVVMILSSFLLGWFLYPLLPEQVPSHWNFRGEIDDYSSKTWGAFGIPLMLLGMYLLFKVLPLIDPKKENYENFPKTYAALKYILTFFFLILYVVIIATSLGYPVSINKIIPAIISILFIAIGNYLTTVRPNYFVGIKTPWTLANETVWKKTHRISGRLWVASGVLGLIAVIFNTRLGSIISLGLIIGTAIFSMFYSWWIYHKQEK